VRHRLPIAAIAIVVLVAVPAPPAADAGAVVAYPGPRWGYASPDTGITFRGVDAASLGTVRVTGSASGEHPGTVHPLTAEPGAVFTPNEPFRPREDVTVTLGGNVHVRGADGPTFTFTTARAPAHGSQEGEPVPGRRERQSRPARGGCHPKRRRFHTLPRLRPIAYCAVRNPHTRLAGGDIVVSPVPAPPHRRRQRAQDAVMVFSKDGKLLWYLPRPDRAHDAEFVTYGGRRMLAFFQRRSDGHSFYELRDRHYRLVTRLFAGNGYRINSHELVVTPRGTAYVSAYDNVVLPGGRPAVDYVVQELDLATHDVLFEWHSLDHVPTWSSYAHRPAGEKAWDYFHGNAIEPDPSGGSTIVVSSRNTSALYGIDGVTGDLRWTFGGKRDEFGVQWRHPSWRFCAQHDARWLPSGNLMLFDNGGSALGGHNFCPRHPARVEEFALDPGAHDALRVGVISSRTLAATRRGYFPGWVGSARRQPGGNLLIDWGTTGQITELTPRGRLALRLRLRGWSYRAVAGRWTGMPPGRPAAAARRRHGSTVVWASWNGATEIRRWQLLAGASPVTLTPTGRRPRFAGLETRMRIRSRPRYVAVRALDAAGAPLAVSKPVRVR
jgi:hypothetical protein